MGAAFGDAALVEDEDLVGVDDGRQAVGDDDGRAAGGDVAQGLLDRRLGAAVERAGRLVEDQDRRVLEQVRAMATRCFSPPDSLRPRSPTRLRSRAAARG